MAFSEEKEGVDPSWCEENPGEAAKMIDDLRDRISEMKGDVLIAHTSQEACGSDCSFEDRLFEKINSLSARMEWLSDRVLAETKMGVRRERTKSFTEDLRDAIEGIYEAMDDGHY